MVSQPHRVYVPYVGLRCSESARVKADIAGVRINRELSMLLTKEPGEVGKLLTERRGALANSAHGRYRPTQL